MEQIEGGQDYEVDIESIPDRFPDQMTQTSASNVHQKTTAASVHCMPVTQIALPINSVRHALPNTLSLFDSPQLTQVVGHSLSTNSTSPQAVIILSRQQIQQILIQRLSATNTQGTTTRMHAPLQQAEVHRVQPSSPATVHTLTSEQTVMNSVQLCSVTPVQMKFPQKNVIPMITNPHLQVPNTIVETPPTCTHSPRLLNKQIVIQHPDACNSNCDMGAHGQHHNEEILKLHQKLEMLADEDEETKIQKEKFSVILENEEMIEEYRKKELMQDNANDQDGEKKLSHEHTEDKLLTIYQNIANQQPEITKDSS